MNEYNVPEGYQKYLKVRLEALEKIHDKQEEEFENEKTNKIPSYLHLLHNYIHGQIDLLKELMAMPGVDRTVTPGSHLGHCTTCKEPVTKCSCGNWYVGPIVEEPQFRCKHCNAVASSDPGCEYCDPHHKNYLKRLKQENTQ